MQPTKNWRQVLFAITAVLLSGTVLSQPSAYPSKPIRVLIPLSPGASADVMVRLVGAGMTAAWGQPIVLEHHPGADTIIAVNRLLQAPPDGYTLMLGAPSTYTVNPLVYEKLPYDPARDLVPVTSIGSLPLLIAVHPSVPAKSLGELVALARSRPGELNYGEPAVTTRIVAEALNQRLGVRMTPISYKGGAGVVAAMLSGTIQVAFVDPAPALPHVKSGKIRALALSSAKRAPYLPEVPTVAEDMTPGYSETFWFGLFAPVGTPRDIVDRLSTEATRVLRTSDARERLLSFGIEAAGSTPQEFLEQLRAQAKRFEQAVKGANISIK